MRNELTRVVSASLLVVLLASCSAARVYVRVARARNDFAQGSYQEANRRLATVRNSGAFEPWIAYNLGAVYYALGEPGAAAEVWSATSGVDSSRLSFLIAYNRGVLELESGNFDLAYEHFRESLLINPSSIEAKVNLEFAFGKLAAVEEERETSSAVTEAGEEIGRLLQYVERIEGTYWKSTEEISEMDGAEDW